MPLEEPSWWYRPGGGMAAALEPLGALYGWAAKARYLRASPYRSRLPVVCIGNFTAGGTGKTPLAIHLARHLKAIGHEPVALTRGYGGRLAGPYWVDAGTDRASDVGDEALLLARAAPTLVARDRRAGARAIETGPHPVTAVVMDDGLQNPTLAKDLTLAVVDGGRGLGNRCVMPAGPLRAPLGFQLELTDAIVVVTPAADGGSETAEWLRHRFAGPVLRGRVTPAGETGWLERARVLAWAGIGAPERFFALLAALGAEVVERAAFRDHQRPGEAEARRLLAAARDKAAMLVTTEKDMARLRGESGAAAELAAASRVLPIELAPVGADAERLHALVEGALAARR